MTLSDGRGLLDTLNGNVENLNQGMDTYLRWRLDRLGRPTLDFGCVHDVTQDVALTAPTCTEDGTAVSVCVRCGEECSEVKAVASLGHDLVTETTPATCTEPGVVRTYCTRCACSESRTVDPIDHLDENGDGLCDMCGRRLSDVEPQGVCRLCGRTHHGFFGFIVRFVHSLIYNFKTLLRIAA